MPPLLAKEAGASKGLSFDEWGRRYALGTFSFSIFAFVVFAFATFVGVVRTLASVLSTIMLAFGAFASAVGAFAFGFSLFASFAPFAFWAIIVGGAGLLGADVGGVGP